MTEIGIAATGFMFNEIDVDNCFPSRVPLTSGACMITVYYENSVASQKVRITLYEEGLDWETVRSI